MVIQVQVAGLFQDCPAHKDGWLADNSKAELSKSTRFQLRKASLFTGRPASSMLKASPYTMPRAGLAIRTVTARWIAPGR
ncbi:MAG: hypothetical protein MUE67_04755 [Anaerolineales bacterium]|nr:hypothetical protein [Anaerolineales bacterium]